VLSLTTCRRGAVGADRLVQARAGDGRATRFDGSDMTMPQQIPDQPAASAEAAQRGPGVLSRQKSHRLARSVAASREGPISRSVRVSPPGAGPEAAPV